jgi:hypothetical protein
MSFACEPELLEDLARGRLDGMKIVELEAHVAGCASCKRELQWLVAERELAMKRAATESASRLPAIWQKVELATLAGAGAGAFVSAQNVARKSIGRFWWRAGAVVGALILGGLIAKAIRGEHRAEREQPEQHDEHGINIHLGTPSPSHGHLISVTAVSGPINLKIGGASSEIRISPGASSLLKVMADDVGAHGIDVKQNGSAVEVLFDGHQARSGTILVEVPVGSSADVNTASGDVTVEKLGAGVNVRTASGEITVEGSTDFDADSASGDVHASEISGRAHVRTVSGDVHLGLAGATHVDINTTSGDLELEGACGAGCGIGYHTISGDASLELDPKSSFNLTYHSRSGDFTDQLRLDEITQRREGGPSGTMIAGRYGRGDATIDVNSLSGDLTLNRQ